MFPDSHRRKHRSCQVFLGCCVCVGLPCVAGVPQGREGKAEKDNGVRKGRLGQGGGKESV